MTLLDKKPIIIFALPVPEPEQMLGSKGMARAEDYVLQNLSVMVRGGAEHILFSTESAEPESLAAVAALGRLARAEFSADLGLIVQPHDPYAPLAIAHAAGFSFVRIKVFVGAMLRSDGIREGCGDQAVRYRHQLGRDDIAILADVHDRTGVPLVDVPLAMACPWAVRTGADALVLTGGSFAESLKFIETARQAGVRRPLIIGGSVNSANVSQALGTADGVIVSTSLLRSDAKPDDLVRWDISKISQFVDAVHAVQG